MSLLSSNMGAGCNCSSHWAVRKSNGWNRQIRLKKNNKSEIKWVKMTKITKKTKKRILIYTHKNGQVWLGFSGKSERLFTLRSAPHGPGPRPPIRKAGTVSWCLLGLTRTPGGSFISPGGRPRPPIAIARRWRRGGQWLTEVQGHLALTPPGVCWKVVDELL